MSSSSRRKLTQSLTSGAIGRLLLAGIGFALAAFALTWLQYRHAARLFPTEIYILCVAVGFTLLGIWAGRQLTAPRRNHDFKRNDAAIRSLGISPRELGILELLADGLANKEVARCLEISPNTVKTHIARLFEKLDVNRRTQAIRKAQELSILP
ncbi:MAG: LuxR C-terminal-related transcriptional regulator [Pseudomonadota bacterium]